MLKPENEGGGKEPGLPRKWSLKWCAHDIRIIVSYPIISLKWQNWLKVGTGKPSLKVKILSVSDDDVREKTSCLLLLFNHSYLSTYGSPYVLRYECLCLLQVAD